MKIRAVSRLPLLPVMGLFLLAGIGLPGGCDNAAKKGDPQIARGPSGPPGPPPFPPPHDRDPGPGGPGPHPRGPDGRHGPGPGGPPPPGREFGPAGPEVMLSIKPAISEGPSASVRFALSGVTEQRADRLYLFLPAIWRRDLEALTAEVAESIDPQIWNRTFETIGRTASVLRAKQALLRQSPFFTEAPRKDLVDPLLAHWDEIMLFIEQTSSSRLADLHQIRSQPLLDFIDDSGNRLLHRIMFRSGPQGRESVERLMQVKVRDVEVKGETAVVEFSGGPLAEPHRVEFVVVDDAWVPRSMANEFPAFLDQAYRWARQFENTHWDAVRPKIMEISTRIMSRLSDLERATDLPAVNSLIVPLATDLNEFGSMLTTTAGAGYPRVGPTGRVTIRLAADLSEEQLSSLLKELLSLCPRPRETEYVASSFDGATHIEIGPVDDIKALAEKIRFAPVKSVEAEQRVIELERPSTPR